MSKCATKNCEDTSGDEGWAYCGGADCSSCGGGCGDDNCKKCNPDPVFGKSEGCCCGATKDKPCACMKKGNMKCSKKEPMCACYKEQSKLEKAFRTGWSIVKAGDFNPDDDTCEACGGQKTPEHPYYAPDGPKNGNCAKELPGCR